MSCTKKLVWWNLVFIELTRCDFIMESISHTRSIRTICKAFLTNKEVLPSTEVPDY